MKLTIDELLQTDCWIVDILPRQVPRDSPGQYFAVEEYYLEPSRLAAVKEKHIGLVLKLNCYRRLSLDDEAEVNPLPARIAGEMRSRYLCIRADDALIVSEPDETYLTVYHPDAALLELLRTLSAGEGLYVWQP